MVGRDAAAVTLSGSFVHHRNLRPRSSYRDSVSIVNGSYAVAHTYVLGTDRGRQRFESNAMNSVALLIPTWITSSAEGT